LSQLQQVFVTISCDNTECDKSVTFQANEQGQAEAFEDNPWLNTHRVVGTADKRQLTYCSDECEAKGIATGTHNKLTRKRIIAPTSSKAEVDLAARAAAQAREADKALREGSPVTLS
jgi:hypothetical protein